MTGDDRKRLLIRAVVLLALLTLLTPVSASAYGSYSSSSYSDKIDPLVIAAAESGATEPLKVVVLPSAGVSAGSVTGLAETVGDSVQVLSAGVLSLEVEADKLNDLAASPLVGYIVPDLPLAPSGASVSSALFGVDYAAVDGAPAAWAKGLDGRGVGIAVIDSGVSQVPDFGTRLVQVPFRSDSDSLDDRFGHGSFVAAVAAGKNPAGYYRGIAPGATVYSLKVAHDDDDAPRTSDIIQALDWVSLNSKRLNIRVAVLALSEGTPTSYHGSLLDASVEHAWRSGVVIVTSAGNRGPNSQYFAPSNDPFVVSVGALDIDGKTPTDFSSSGKTPDGYHRPDVYAPGRHITSVLLEGSTFASMAPAANIVSPGYGKGNGTSFAAPQVAGAVAILLQQRPTLTPDQVKWLLVKSGRSISGQGVALDIAALLKLRATDEANEGVPIGNCTGGDTLSLLGQLHPCSLPGSAYLALYDCSKASYHNQKVYKELGWDGASWNGASWNGASWNGASWNGASWNAAAWNGASWNGAGWN